MRARTTIIILFLAIIFVMAGNVMQVAQKNHSDEETKDSLAIDSLDTLTSDSIKHLISDIKHLPDSLAEIDPLDTLTGRYTSATRLWTTPLQPTLQTGSARTALTSPYTIPRTTRWCMLHRRERLSSTAIRT